MAVSAQVYREVDVAEQGMNMHCTLPMQCSVQHQISCFSLVPACSSSLLLQHSLL